MQRLILFFAALLFLPHFVKAHKPKVQIATYGNVKTYFFSDFNFGDKTIESQELKIRVIGKLAERMLEKLHYTDTVMIEYKKPFDEERLFILENDNSNYKIIGFTNGEVIKSNGYGFSVRIIDKNLDVINILKLLEYSIVNRKNINKYLQPVKLRYDHTNELTILANTEDFIKKVTGYHSDLVKEITTKETELLDNGFMQTRISWKDGNFIFGYNEIPPTAGKYTSDKKAKYILKDFTYYIESNWGDFFVIFSGSDCFT